VIPGREFQFAKWRATRLFCRRDAGQPELDNDKLARGIATLRDLDSGEQCEIALDTLAPHLSALTEITKP